MARKTIETLLDREQLLNMNNNFEELYTNVNNIKDKSNEIDNLKNELKDTIQKVEDTEIKDNSIDGSKIIDNSIEANKLAIFETNETSNLLDLTKIKKDTSLNTDGSIKSEQRYWLTDLIPFDASKNERLNITYGSYRIFTYDKNGNYIGPRAITQGDSLTIEPTSETKYIRISGAKSLSEVMINKGDALLPYEKPIQKGDIKLKDEYYNHFELENKSIRAEHIDDKAIQTEHIDDGTITPEKTSFIKTSNNLLDLSKVLKNTSVDLSANVIAEEGRWLTGLIPFDASKNEKINITDGSYRVGTYDENIDPIGRRAITNDNKLVIENTSKTKYIRISGTKDLSEVMINKGDTLLPYEEFGYTFSSNIVPTQSGGGTVVQGGTIVHLENSKQISNEVSEVYLSKEKRNIYSTTKTSQLDYVEISTNSVDAEIVLSYSDEENNTVLANTSVPGELEELPLTLQNIVEYGYPDVEYLYYDPKKASYKIALKNLNFSNGFELSIRNSGASTINITTKIVGRYYV